MKKNLLLLTSIILLMSCQKENKTAFVKTETIFNEYKGTKDQEAIFKKQHEAFNKKYDSIEKQFQAEVIDFQQKSKKMSLKQAEQKNQELYQKQMIIQQMKRQESAQLNAEIQKKTDSIIKKVYDFLNQYGKNNAYQYIYGKNNSGSLMYGNSKNDITELVLKALNKAYESEKK